MSRRNTSSEMHRRAGGWESWAPYVIAVVMGPFVLLWLAGLVAAKLTGHPYRAGVGELFGAIGHPTTAGESLGAGSTLLVWFLFVVFLGALVGLIVLAVRTTRGASEKSAREIQNEKGLPSARIVKQEYGPGQLLKRGPTLRPDFVPPNGRKPVPEDYGFFDGTCKGVKVYTSFETPTMLIAPSRSGKSQNYIGPRVVQAPGAVVSTSTKVELVRMTWEHREKLGGPMLICDPEGVGAEAGLPGTTSWCLWAGCENVSEALARARVLAESSSGGVENAGFWEATTKRVLAPLLHAAAIDADVTMTDFQKWCFDPKFAKDAVEILQNAKDAADLAAMLVSVVEMDDVETRANMWAPVSNIGLALVEPKVRATFGAEGPQLNVREFLEKSGTIYIIGQKGGLSSQLILCLVDAVWRTALRMANGKEGGRIEPPMHMSLDEIGNLGRLPDLPRMISEGGGLGIQTTAAFQTPSQAETQFGKAEADTLWEAATQKALLAGVSNDHLLSGMSRAAGPRWHVQESTSSGRWNDGPGRSYQEQREEVLTAHQIETMRKGLGVVNEAGKPVIVVEYVMFDERYSKPKKPIVKKPAPVMTGGEK